MTNLTACRELKPCPFCGSAAKHEVWSVHNYHRVGCEECDFERDYFEDAASAMAAWNTRADQGGETARDAYHVAKDAMVYLRDDLVQDDIRRRFAMLRDPDAALSAQRGEVANG